MSPFVETNNRLDCRVPASLSDPATDGSAPVGSDAGTRGKEYEGGHTVRIRQFNAAVNLEALQAFASELRSQPCIVSPGFSVGQHNLVRKITFRDGVNWIARLKMPPMEGEPSTADATLNMQSELATMEFVSYAKREGIQRTVIPIPKVHAYNLDGGHPVGCSFSIMDYVNGNTAEEVSSQYGGGHEGVPIQFREKFWRQMAEIAIQLASIRMPAIGCIVWDPADQHSFVVGPLTETGSGPYASAAAFYADYPLVLDRKLANGSEPVDGQGEVVKTFRSLAASFPPPAAGTVEAGLAGNFGLANFDLNPNNVLVDREFNVLAVIDWDSVAAVPDAALYRFPFLMGLSYAIPGVVEEHPAEKNRQLCGLQFAAVVEAVAVEMRRKYGEGVYK
ncbi:hypothetical protein F4818DRAFT_453963 [Hypoxylon cercidicola]|nr:hypothetical protein F4818DRAFT_453963 [Hypoxylon cercidicola]